MISDDIGTIIVGSPFISVIRGTMPAVTGVRVTSPRQLKDLDAPERLSLPDLVELRKMALALDISDCGLDTSTNRLAGRVLFTANPRLAC